MHLDERLEKSREVIGKQLAVGQKKVSSAFNNLWAEMEAMREAQRLKREAELQASASSGEKQQHHHHHHHNHGAKCRPTPVELP
jgi:hypothetical protein